MRRAARTMQSGGRRSTKVEAKASGAHARFLFSLSPWRLPFVDAAWVGLGLVTHGGPNAVRLLSACEGSPAGDGSSTQRRRRERKEGACWLPRVVLQPFRSASVSTIFPGWPDGSVFVGSPLV